MNEKDPFEGIVILFFVLSIVGWFYLMLSLQDIL